MKLICCSENKSRPRTSWNESPTHSGIGGGSLRGPSPYENTSRNPAAVRTPSPTRDVNAAGFLSYAPNNQKRTVSQPENKKMNEKNKSILSEFLEYLSDIIKYALLF